MGAQLNFKLVSMGLIAAVAVNLTAVSSMAMGGPLTIQGARKKEKSKAKPRPPVSEIPTVPSKPDAPILPGLPNSPDLPNWPDIPLPGDPHNPKGGPEVPFPMSTTLPFPWGNIEGIWKVEIESASLLFSFKIENDMEKHQYLRVLQLDAANGGLMLAEGVGLRIEGDKLVRVAMMSKVDKSGSYMLFIGSYKNDGKLAVRLPQAGKSVTVLTVRSFSDLMGKKDLQVIVTKISNTPYSEQKYLPKPGETY